MNNNERDSAPSKRQHQKIPTLLFALSTALVTVLVIILWPKPNTPEQSTESPRVDTPVQPEPPDPLADRIRGVNAVACQYNFCANIKTVSGTVYSLCKIQTLSRFPFPPPVKEQFGRLLVMARAPTNATASGAAPYQHFWFSKIKRLRNVARGLEILTTSGQTFVSESGWLSNYRHKRYGYESKDTYHDVIIGLTDTEQIGIDTLEIDEIEFTTEEQENQRFDAELTTVLPPPQPAVFHYENHTVSAGRFFLLDAAGSWYKTEFLHLWWPGYPDLTIWHERDETNAEFWNYPQVTVSKSEVKSMEFGPAPDFIRTKVSLRSGESLSGYFVTRTESQKGQWQWDQGRQGFWDSLVICTEEGLDVYALFPGGPRFAEMAQDTGALSSILFTDGKPEEEPK